MNQRSNKFVRLASGALVLGLAHGSAAARLPTLNYDALLDGGTDSVWDDAANGGHDFALSGVVYDGSPTGAPSGVGAVYTFDGNDIAAFGANKNIENISAGNPTQQDVSFEVIFRAHTDNRQEIIWELGGSSKGTSMTINNGVLGFYTQDGGDGQTAAISANTFYHVVGTLNRGGDELKLYVNGTLIGGAAVAYSGADWAGTDGGTDGAIGGKTGSTVGGQTAANGISNFGRFDGDVAAFRLYKNTVLTQADVDELYAATGIPEPGSLALMACGGLMMIKRRRR